MHRRIDDTKTPSEVVTLCWKFCLKKNKKFKQNNPVKTLNPP